MRNGLKRLSQRVTFTFISLIILSFTFKDSIIYHGLLSLAVASLVMTVLYNTLRPIIVVVSLPVIAISFGVFFALINAFVIYLTDKITPGFNVNCFWYSILAGLAVGLVNYLVDRKWFGKNSGSQE